MLILHINFGETHKQFGDNYRSEKTDTLNEIAVLAFYCVAIFSLSVTIVVIE